MRFAFWFLFLAVVVHLVKVGLASRKYRVGAAPRPCRGQRDLAVRGAAALSSGLGAGRWALGTAAGSPGRLRFLRLSSSCPCVLKRRQAGSSP